MTTCFCTRMILVAMMMTGCSFPSTDPPRLKTFPVKGIVRVDGQPVEKVTVTFNPEGKSSAIKYPTRTFTNGNGEFAAATYSSGDGLPEGTYNLTFAWNEFAKPAKSEDFQKKEGGARDGVDRLKKAYSDPAKSKHKITVKGENTDLDVIELSSKGPETP